MSVENGAAEAPKLVSTQELCGKIGERLDEMLAQISRAPEGQGPAFAFILWTDGNPAVYYATNRQSDALANALMGVLTHLAEAKSTPAQPAIVVPTH